MNNKSVIRLIEIKEIRERANIYLKNISYVFCIERLPSGKQNYWNGFVTDIKTDLIVFFDLKLMRECPIPLDSIYALEISRTERLTETMAREFYFQWRKETKCQF